jgi:hypothetical protein
MRFVFTWWALLFDVGLPALVVFAMWRIRKSASRYRRSNIFMVTIVPIVAIILLNGFTYSGSYGHREVSGNARDASSYFGLNNGQTYPVATTADSVDITKPYFIVVGMGYERPLGSVLTLAFVATDEDGFTHKWFVNIPTITGLKININDSGPSTIAITLHRGLVDGITVRHHYTPCVVVFHNLFMATCQHRLLGSTMTVGNSVKKAGLSVVVEDYLKETVITVPSAVADQIGASQLTGK